MTVEPTRTCVGCGERKPQSALQRLGLVGDGLEQKIERGRAIPGRGAWICRASGAECFQLANEKKSFNRAFKRRLEPGALDNLARHFA